MLPWIALAASAYMNRKAKKEEKKQLLADISMRRAQELGADISPIQATLRRREIDDRPIIDSGQLMSAIGSTVEQDTVDDRLAKEMARRGLMRGYQPF